jgi:hypothetical protein
MAFVSKLIQSMNKLKLYNFDSKIREDLTICATE